MNAERELYHSAQAVSAEPQKAAAHPAGGIMTAGGHDIMNAERELYHSVQAVSAEPQKAAV